MSEIERIQRYIERTKISPKAAYAYCLYDTDMRAFFEELDQNWYHAVCLIFNYGQAKGYRAAKAEARARA